MDESKSAAPGEAVGLNPHYRPPLMVWNHVEIVSEPGYEFGIVADEAGVLQIAVRKVGHSWPKEMNPQPSSVNTIAEGFSRYIVTSGERGPAVGHEFAPDPANPGICAACGK